MPGIILEKKDRTYCLGFLPLDYVEKKIVDQWIKAKVNNSQL